MANEGFPPIDRPEGWSTVEVPGEDSDPGARFWVRAVDPDVREGYGGSSVDRPVGRTPFDDLRDEIESGQ